MISNDKETGEKVKASANPDELSKFVSEVEFKKKLQKIQPKVPLLVSAKESFLSERRVWRV